MTNEEILAAARECGAYEYKGHDEISFSLEELFTFAQRIQDEQKRRDAEICAAERLWSWTDLENYGEKFVETFNTGVHAGKNAILATIKDKP